MVSYHTFFKKVVFYKPFNVEFKGITKEEISEINCVGYSPLGKKQYFDKNISLCSFGTSYYSHCREITFEIPDSICEKITEINFTYGKNTESIQKEKINIQWIRKANKTNTDNNYNNLSDIVKPDNSVFGIYFSVLLWGGYIRIVYIILLALIFVVSFYFLYRSKKATLLRIRGKAYKIVFSVIPLKIHHRINRLLTSLFLMILFSII